MNPPKIKVLIVDDHGVVRSGFREVLQSTDDIEVAGEAGTAADAFRQAAATSFDIILLDISLPDAPGLETVMGLQRKHPDMAILIVSMHDEEAYAVNLMRAGASGFFPKAGAAADLVRAIRTVAAGKKFVSASLAETFALQTTGDKAVLPHQALSTREFQIFIHLAGGNTVTEVGKKLFLSVKTVSTHRARILEKMNFTTNADITAYALQHHLIG